MLCICFVLYVVANLHETDQIDPKRGNTYFLAYIKSIYI